MISANKQRENLENGVKYSDVVLLRLEELGNSLLSGSQLGLVATMSCGLSNGRTYRVVVATDIYTPTAHTTVRQ